MGTSDISDGSLPAVSVNEKESINKQKTLSARSPDISVDASNHSSTKVSEERMFQSTLSELGLIEARFRDALEEEAEEPEYADWYGPVACLLEQCLITNLLAIYWAAEAKIAKHGYDRGAAQWAILNSGLCHSNNDVLSNIVTGALVFLTTKKYELNTGADRYSIFKGQLQMIDYTILEMVHVLREVKPNLSVAEAMWCLLISDLNLSDACMMDGGSSSAYCGHKLLKEKLTLSQSKIYTSGTRSSDSNKREDPRKSMLHGESSEPETHVPRLGHQLSKYESPGQASSLALEEAKGKFYGIDREHIQTSSGATISCETSEGSRKVSSAVSKRDRLSRKVHSFEKNRGHPPKEAIKAITSLSDSTTRGRAGNPVVVLPSANSKSPESSTTHPNNGTLQKCVPQADKDKLILMLVSTKQAREKELQGWTDWASEKIIQVTQRLQKNQGELKRLRQRKEARTKLEEERFTLEGLDKQMQVLKEKQMSKMELEFFDITGQIRVSNAKVRRLGEKNSVLRKEMEDAKAQARESATKLQGALDREQETLHKSQLVYAERLLLWEQLNDLKYQVAELDNKIEKAKKRQNNFMDLLKHEEKEKERALMQIDALRKEREADDALTKAEVDSIKQMAETNMHKCKEDIRNLENMISESRLEMSKSRIAAHNLTNLPKITKGLAVFQDSVGGKRIKRERECVMCMEEEFSVVFLPCVHQVLCGKCSELHEQKGMNDCPTCRAVIQKRVLVRYRDD